MAVVVFLLLALQIVNANVITKTEIIPICRPNTDCKLISYSPQEYIYEVNGEKLVIKIKDEKYFKVSCEGSALTAARVGALPARPRAGAVARVEFAACRLADASLTAVMSAFNVSATRHLELFINKNHTALQRHHFSNLNLSSLLIDGKALPIKDDFLNDVKELEALKLQNVRLSDKAQLNFPVTLTKLDLNDALVTPLVSLQWLGRLRSLSSLVLMQESNGAPLIPPFMHQFPNLTAATLQVPLKIPPLWLNGSALKTLSLNSCGLQDVPSDMFHGVNLTSLSMNRNKLRPPQGLIIGQRSLRFLDVTSCGLRGEDLVTLVTALESLEELRANYNPLGSLCAGYGYSLTGPRSDFVFQVSSRLPLTLRRLHLRGSGATQVCTDWVLYAHALEFIDLSNNSVSVLTYLELEMSRQGVREVLLNLSLNPLVDVTVSAEDVAACQNPPADPDQVNDNAPVRLVVSGLHCDCYNAHFRSLLASCPRVRLEPAPCLPPPLPAALAAPSTTPPTPPPTETTTAPKEFLDYRAEELLCDCRPDDNFTVPGCSCRKRIQDRTTVLQCSGAVDDARWPAAAPLALSAVGAGLTAVPRARLVELNATNNSISELREEDISDTLLILDLRNNSIEHISVETARRLGSAASGKKRSVWLAGNALACSCEDRDAIESLMSERVKNNLMDWRELRCRDGRELSTLVPSDLCLNPLILAILSVAGVILVLALAAPFALRWALPRLKQFLFDRQMCLNWVLRAHDDPDDPTKTHDVFISYAYADRKLAMKLRQWLDDKGFSTVEHSRDWMAGVAVTEHIAASVRCARRTLLLVSDSFAASAWGLQEFHAAHAHALEKGSARIIPVRCHLSALNTLPDDLRLYLYNNTYLSYDDPEFWSKLLRVMPPLRGAPPVVKEPPLAAQFIPPRADAPAAC